MNEVILPILSASCALLLGPMKSMFGNPSVHLGISDTKNEYKLGEECVPWATP